jgi:hypothetical protein
MNMATSTPQSSSSRNSNCDQQRTLPQDIRVAAIQRLGLADDPSDIQDKVSDELISRLMEHDSQQVISKACEAGSIQELLSEFRRELMIDSFAVTISSAPVPEELDLLALSFHPENSEEREKYFDRIHSEIEKALAGYERSDFFFGERSFGVSAVRVAPGELLAIGDIARLEGVRRLS